MEGSLCMEGRKYYEVLNNLEPQFSHLENGSQSFSDYLKVLCELTFEAEQALQILFDI